jgi:hypothetical protein
MRSGDREPQQGGDSRSRLLCFLILGVIVVLFALFLALRPRGSESPTPTSPTSQH